MYRTPPCSLSKRWLSTQGSCRWRFVLAFAELFSSSSYLALWLHRRHTGLPSQQANIPPSWLHWKVVLSPICLLSRRGHPAEIQFCTKVPTRSCPVCWCWLPLQLVRSCIMSIIMVSLFLVLNGDWFYVLLVVGDVCERSDGRYWWWRDTTRSIFAPASANCRNLFSILPFTAKNSVLSVWLVPPSWWWIYVYFWQNENWLVNSGEFMTFCTMQMTNVA